MVHLQQRVLTYVSLLIFTALAAHTQSALTQIQDTVYASSGVPFNGNVIVTWTGTAGTGPSNTSVRISNGVLSVQLAPSTTITPAGYYQAVYNSSDGLTTWTETWAVPPSATPVTLSQVRVTNAGGSSGGGGGTTGAIQISQVVGLASDLNAINSSLTTFNSVTQGLNLLISNLTTTVNGLSNTVGNLAGTTNALFVDAEAPAGTMDGSNTAFTLANVPALPSDVYLYRNGLLLANGVDYTMNGKAITFANGAVPQPADELLAYYRISGTGPSATFVDGETPGGALDGKNPTFTLVNTPNPAASLKLSRNGILLEQNIDYTLANQIVTFTSNAVLPGPGDVLLANYRR